MQSTQLPDVNPQFSHLTDAELERLCYNSFPTIPILAQEELVRRFGEMLNAPAAPKNKYK